MSRLLLISVFAAILLCITADSFDEKIESFIKSADVNHLPNEVKLFLSNMYKEVGTNSNWCCAIDPPSKPVFSHTGDLLYYEPQKCPNEYLVCCKGHININGNCLDFNEVAQYLTSWQSLAGALGISTLEAMQLLTQLG